MSNYWIKTPAFSTEDLAYNCNNNKNLNSEALALSQGETLEKIIDSYAFTGDIDHYLLSVTIQFWIIDVNTKSF